MTRRPDATDPQDANSVKDEAVSISNLVVAYDETPVVKGVSFDVQPGEVVAIVGPSGCGKTTLLRAIGGLEDPRAGSIHIGGRCVFDAESGIHVPTEQRNINMVFQSYAIWPHMTVAANVAYGLRVRKMGASEISEKVDQALGLVGLSELRDRNATALSGGQQQRVAVARAIVTEPSLVLFDEPLSNLDAQLRIRMRNELRALVLKLGRSAIYVTHDREEAFVIADRILVMNQGVVEQVGTARQLYEQPRSRFVAQFIGESVELACRVASGAPDRVELADGIAITDISRSVDAAALEADAECVLITRPSWIRLAATPREEASPVTVTDIRYLGERCLLDIEGKGLGRFEVEVSVGEADQIELGAGLFVDWSKTKLFVFER